MRYVYSQTNGIKSKEISLKFRILEKVIIIIHIPIGYKSMHEVVYFDINTQFILECKSIQHIEYSQIKKRNDIPFKYI